MMFSPTELPLFDQQSNFKQHGSHTGQIELFPKYECYRVQVFLKEKYTIKKTDWSTKIELILLLCYDNRIGTRRR